MTENSFWSSYFKTQRRGEINVTRLALIGMHLFLENRPCCYTKEYTLLWAER